MGLSSKTITPWYKVRSLDEEIPHKKDAEPKDE
jgi:hypothetical protein